MQTSFPEVEYEAKKKQTRRDRFLSGIAAATSSSRAGIACDLAHCDAPLQAQGIVQYCGR